MISDKDLEQARSTVTYLGGKKSLTPQEAFEYNNGIMTIHNDAIQRLRNRVSELENIVKKLMEGNT